MLMFNGVKKKITKQEWDKIPTDYKGVWRKETIEYRKDIPKDWEGRRTYITLENNKTVLLTEGVHFEIVD